MLLKFLHIVLSFQLMVSSVGVTVFEHMCSKNGSSFALFKKPENCCSKKKSKACCNRNKSKTCSLPSVGKNKKEGTNSINNIPCCQDIAHHAKLNISAPSWDKVIFNTQKTLFFSANKVFYFPQTDVQTTNEKTIKFHLYHPPPLLKGNLRVIYQSFLC